MTVLAASPRRAAQVLGPVLEVRDVTVRFGGLVALDSVSINAAHGDITGVIGPNGAGKSTLFAVISGSLRPSSGIVLLDGVPVIGAGLERVARRGLGRSFQQAQIFAELTVRQHLVLARRLRRTRSAARLLFDRLERVHHEDDEAVERLLESLGLARRADALAADLPLATLRLLEIARALAWDPSVLLLDEPMAGLDSVEVREVAAVLRQATKEHDVSLLLVEHDVGVVLDLCDRIHVLDFGRLLASGTPSEIADDDAVRAAYLGVGTER